MNSNWMKVVACLAIAAVLFSTLVSCAPATPEVVEKEVPVTVEVEKEVVVEKEIPVTVEVEKEVVVEKGVPYEVIQALEKWVGGKGLAEAEPQYGGTLTIAFVPLVTHIDTNDRMIRSLHEVAQYFYETLFARAGDGESKPLLVKEEQVSPDGLTVIWKLQPGVKFCDGTPFDAAAVKWNLERKIEKKQTGYVSISGMNIEVVDDLTVKLTLPQPRFSLQANLSMPTYSMYSPSFAEKVGDDGLKTQACGTGPFMVTEFKPNEILRLKKNPNYWQEGLPFLDEVVFLMVPDQSARATMLLAGDVDVALDLSTTDYERLKGAEGYKVLEGVGSKHYYIVINTFYPPLDDIRVRKALNHAIDKEGLSDAAFLGAADPAKALSFTPTVDGYAEAGYYEYDPEKAKALLDEAGVVDIDGDGIREDAGTGRERAKDGRKLVLELKTRKGGETGDFQTAELVQGMLKAVGINVNITVLESATFWQDVTMEPEESNYDLVSQQVNFFSGDADSIMNNVIVCDAWAPKAYDRMYYCNPDVDKMYYEGTQVAVTLAERNEIYAKIVKQVFDDCPGIPLLDPLEQAAMKDTVHGVYLSGSLNNWPAKYAWIEK